MDDYGILVYVAFLVISLIGGWLKREGKKKEEQKSPSSANQNRPSAQPVQLDLDEILGRKKEQKQMAEQRLREMEQEAQRALEQSKLSGKKTYTRQRPKREPKLEPVETETSSDWDDFDARKAIIYSEILNPPYL